MFLTSLPNRGLLYGQGDGWVAFKTPLWDIILRFGLPQSIQSDNGSGFISQITQQVSTSLHNTWLLHIPYYPQCSRNIGKANGLINTHLINLILELHQPWPQLLPLARTKLRTLPWAHTYLSPFELIYGRPFLLHKLPTCQELPSLLDYIPILTFLKHLLCEHAKHSLPQPSGQTKLDTFISRGYLIYLTSSKPVGLQPKWSGLPCKSDWGLGFWAAILVWCHPSKAMSSHHRFLWLQLLWLFITNPVSHTSLPYPGHMAITSWVRHAPLLYLVLNPTCLSSYSLCKRILGCSPKQIFYLTIISIWSILNYFRHAYLPNLGFLPIYNNMNTSIFLHSIILSKT